MRAQSNNKSSFRWVLLVCALTFGCQASRRQTTSGLESATSEGVSEVLRQTGNRIEYGFCRLAAGVKAGCVPEPKSMTYLALPDYREVLQRATPVSEQEQRVRRMQGEATALAQKLVQQQSAVERLVKDRRKAESDSSREGVQKSLDRQRQRIAETTAQLKKIRSQTLPEAEDSLKQERQKIDALLALLATTTPLVNPSGKNGNALAFVPFRYTAETCPAGQSWQTSGASPGCCTSNGKCRLHPVDPPNCSLTGPDVAFGGAPIDFVIHVGGGPASKVALLDQLHDGDLRDRPLRIIPANASETATERAYTAHVRGPGGAGECSVKIKVNPNCPAAFRWSPELLCCAAWMECRCGALTATGNRWDCRVGETWRHGDKCYAPGTRENRLTCLMPQDP